MKKRTKEILAILDEQYGREYVCYLNYETPWQLLIATMLSAQCTGCKSKYCDGRSVSEI